MNKTPIPTSQNIQGTRKVVGFVAAILITFVLGVLINFGWRAYGGFRSLDEWGDLYWAEGQSRDKPFSTIEFAEHHSHHFACVQGFSGARIWIMLDARYESFYKQRPPEEGYQLTEEEFLKILASTAVSSTVRHALESHVFSRAR